MLFIGYDEKLAHIIYAGADFILMPSRVEPCGLNQMYALRYGTVPIVNAIGGLKDTIIDIEEESWFWYLFIDGCYSVEKVTSSNYQEQLLFIQIKKSLLENSKKIMSIDHSWNNSAAQEYVNLYKSLK